MIKALREAATEGGRSGFLLANIEYGLGKAPSLVNFMRCTKSLVVVDFALAMFLVGLDVASFRDNGDGNHTDHNNHMLQDSAAVYRMNPMHIGFGDVVSSVSSNTTNATMFAVETSEPLVYGFTSTVASTNGHGELRCYFMNKLDTTINMDITLPSSVPLLKSGVAMVGTPNHWG